MSAHVDLKELAPWESEQLLVSWDRRHPPAATVSDIDLLALRDTIIRLEREDLVDHIDDLLSGERTLSVFVPALCTPDRLSRTLRPLNFTLLLFGRIPQRYCSGAFALFSLYAGTDRSTPVSRRYEIAGTVLQQATRLLELLEGEAHLVMDKEDRDDPHHWRYPVRALHEVVVNALVHRSYELPHPVRVTVFSDRIEVYSPGGLDRGVNAQRLAEGTAVAVWRNQALAWIFNQLKLAQGEGQGIATTHRLMRANGNPPPEFDLTEESVVCTLRAHPKALAAVARGGGLRFR